MSDLPPALRAFLRAPGAQLVAGGAALALAFPGRLAGSVGVMILLGAAGIGAGWAWGRLPRWLVAPPGRVATAIVVAIVVMLGFDTFWDAMTVSPDWQMGDWGPQHAVLARALHALPGLDLPVWNHAVGTGDAPFELYPKLAYLVTGHAALALGLERDLPLAYMVVAVLVHIGLSVGTTLMAARVAPRPVALVVGAMNVVESGAVAEGGPVDIFRWALLHSSLAFLCFLVAALGVLSFLERARMRAVVAIWIGTAVATIAHPIGLVAAAAAGVALVGVALLAHDVPVRRPLVAAGHVVVGVAIGAAVWMPLGERILAYGQHFPNRIFAASDVLRELLHEAWPTSAFGVLILGGYAGIVLGLWSRRATHVFVAVMALVLLVGTTDAPYMAFDLAPGYGTSRLGTVRLVALSRFFLGACGAYTFWVVIAHAARGWPAASSRRRMIALAVAGVLTGAVVRELPAVWRELSNKAFSTTRELAPDPDGRDQLTGWAYLRALELRPDAWARAMIETDTHEHFHLTALTGLPTFHLAPQPDLLLRERIEDASPESLRRFDVRWVIAQDKSPALGDPASEITLGSFHIRELREWDGAFARIERGRGTVRTVRLDDEAVEIEVIGTEPVLVALGTGYYPRWRARHASGTAEPVSALPAVPGGNLHVVSAWVQPGRTSFTCDGPLPSDGDGRVLSVLGLLAAIGGTIAWRIRRVRVRALRRLAALRARIPALGALALRVAVPVLLLGLAIRGCVDEAAPAPALQLGTGLRGAATVEARVDGGAWETCAYSRLAATYECPQKLVAFDAMTSLVNDAPPSWNFTTPGIAASAHADGVEMRITLEARLDGRYLLGTSGGPVTIIPGNDRPRTARRAAIDYVDIGRRTIVLTAEVPPSGWSFTLVRESAIVPDRDFLQPPPSRPSF